MDRIASYQPGPNRIELARKLQDYLRCRNANARYPDVLAAQRRERGPHPQRTPATLGAPKTQTASHMTNRHMLRSPR